jgi:hypothetical protein
MDDHVIFFLQFFSMVDNNVLSPLFSFHQKQHERVKEQMEVVGASLSMSADSLTIPQLTLEELDEIIKVRAYLGCSSLP